MHLNKKQQRQYIEQHFMKSSMTASSDNLSNGNATYDSDPFLPNKPSMYDKIENVAETNDTNSFNYLYNNILTENMTSFSRDLSEAYKLHLCMFSINQKLDTPFLQIMFSNNDSLFKFPTIDLDMTPLRDANNDNITASTMTDNADDD